MSETWWWSEHEDGSWSGPADSRAEAVEEILAELEPGETGYVGRQGPLPMSHLVQGGTLERVIENVCGELDSEHPDYEAWPGAVTRAQEDELDSMLDAAFKAWMEKHGFSLPNVILDVEPIEKT